ncbi:ribosomal RNA processing protein 36 [Catenaria anguillulae PL171]|uniref:rRNA biogenesis protein RRP36 n=1 Tax=Catenaria anguillulae PL171 TaxID=765915 RepID=A0A1Y2HI33_9FUNG|nr:ribosomal RNA processing protein 36 [Catenaria anguillulae PL171]
MRLYRPMEMTSKRPVSRFREAVKVQKMERRDPRFDNLSGHFNQGLFDKAYGFVYDLRSQEIHQLKQQLAKEKDPHQAQQLMRTIQAMENRERARKEAKVKQRIKRDWRKQELDKVKEGKKPFFLKQSEQKKLYLINKLKGRTDRELDKVAEKKRKRDAGKDWKWMPKRRRTGDGGA